jgi:hypothetical protein
LSLVTRLGVREARKRADTKLNSLESLDEGGMRGIVDSKDLYSNRLEVRPFLNVSVFHSLIYPCGEYADSDRVMCFEESIEYVFADPAYACNRDLHWPFDLV